VLTQGMTLLLKRVYDPPSPEDGFRILVDRLWPRGLSRDRAEVDLWAKDVAPSAALRTAFHHDGLPWDAFVSAYRTELQGSPALAQLRRTVAEHDRVTLLFGAHDPQHNQAVVLRDLLAGG